MGTTAAPISIVKSETSEISDASPEKPTSLPDPGQYDVLVAGALAADICCDYAPLEGFTDTTTPLLRTSNPAIFSHSVGGVGHNVAVASHYAGASTLLCTAVGNDITGRALIEHVQESGLSVSGIKVLGSAAEGRTAQYVAMNDTKKDLVIAMADMSILSSFALDSEPVWKSWIAQHRPRWIVIDSNWSTSIMTHIATAARSTAARIAFEPVSAQKASRLISLMKPDTAIPNHLFNLATPNILELQTIYNAAWDAMLFETESWWSVINALNLSRTGSRDRFIQMTNMQLVDQGVPQQCLQLLPYIPCIVTKLGAEGCLLSQLLQPGDPRLRDPDSAPYVFGRALEDGGTIGGVYMRLFPPSELVKQEEVASVNGVGDTLLGVLVAGLAKKGGEARVEDVLMLAQEAAVRTLKSTKSVSEEVRGILGRLN